jgi:alpha-D-ribose 1-methylphosphonate 5-triphosphate diphosphatase
MTKDLPSLRLTGARVLRDGVLQERSISFADGKITRGPLQEVDLSGYLVLPGIVDIHGDGFERHISPRPTAPFPMAAGLASFDREAAAHGVTTAFLAQGWSWEGGHRSPDQAEALCVALELYRARSLTELRIQIRAETHLVDAAHRLLDLVKKFKIGYVVFNNHLSEGQHMARISPTDFAAWARKVGKTAEEMAADIEAAHLCAADVPASLRMLAEGFDKAGVLYGSHDDPDGETREFYALIGAQIAEFPLTRRAAATAHSMMNPIIMGAPNVVRGRSQAGNISAQSLVADGLCDVLVSDYHVPALPLAVWTLVDRGLLDLPRAWGMISTRPAEVLRLADRGKLEPGLRADMVVVNPKTREIEATICGGKLTSLAGEAAARFMTVPFQGVLAAE